MSRFEPISKPPQVGPLHDYKAANAPMLLTLAPATNSASATPILVAQPEVSAPGTVGYVFLCIYIVSGFANEFAMRWLNGKAYLSTAALMRALPSDGSLKVAGGSCEVACFIQSSCPDQLDHSVSAGLRASHFAPVLQFDQP
jgi:hypothetical protein